MRRAAKVDATQEAIVSALRAAGASVQSLAAVGKGVPDLLCGLAGETWLIECKDGAKVPSKRVLTPDQVEWIAAWRGKSVIVACGPEDALRGIGAIA
jgi:Holliday junction resolvase